VFAERLQTSPARRAWCGRLPQRGVMLGLWQTDVQLARTPALEVGRMLA